MSTSSDNRVAALDWEDCTATFYVGCTAPEIVSGVTMCSTCRERDAVLVVDPGERFARPLCFDCVEDEIERDLVQAEWPAFGELLDRARKDVRYKPRHPIVTDYENLDHRKLNALQRQARAFPAKVSDLERCWAILPNGRRCGRKGGSEGVCETHAAVGARLPGLGWRGDQPLGRIVIRRGRSRTHGEDRGVGSAVG